MAKGFIDTFPTVTFNETQQGLLSHVMVRFINRTSDNSAIRVYIDSDRLILKKQILAIERKLQEALIPGGKPAIRICEKYHLSAQYDLENLLVQYKDSIIMDFAQYSLVESNLLRGAVWKIRGEDMLEITFRDGRIVRAASEDMKARLLTIINDRCGVECGVTFAYAEPVKKEVPEYEYDGDRERIAAQPGAGQEIVETSGQVPDIAAETGGAEIKDTVQGGAQKSAAPASGAPSGENSQPTLRRTGKDWKKNGKGKGDDFGRTPSLKRSDNPQVIYGRDFYDDTTQICEIRQEMGEVVVRGRVLTVETRELRKGDKTIVSFALTDMTDSIMAKIFVPNDHLKELLADVAPGKYLAVKGMTLIDKYDHELGLASISGIKKTEDTTVKRMDNAPVKRVELHCHSKMSEMDGVSEVADIVGQAQKWGMTSLALTDHGVIYGFPVANHAIKNPNFKMIYGVEGYLVDDLKDLVCSDKGQNLETPVVVFDLETTGFSPVENHIIEIGAVKYDAKGNRIGEFSTFVNPKEPIPFRIEQLTGIDDSMVADAPAIEAILPQFLEFCGDCVLVAHNAHFDVSFIKENASRLGLPFDPTYLDTVSMARVLLPTLAKFKLDTVAKELGVSLENHHRAVDDAECCAGIYLKLRQRFLDDGVVTLKDLEARNHLSPEAIKKLPTYHIIIIAKNEVGRVNLYKLISMSHIDYFARRPRIPRSEILSHREGLIIGSACEAGELFRGILNNATDEEIARMVRFYDYLEIQPIGNNRFLIDAEDNTVHSEEDLKNLNRRIVQLGEEFHKPVCATCDVHFLNPDDEVYRRIIMAGQGFEDADRQPPLFLRTTEEMLSEFQYLGSEKAEEVVITNTNLIADMCEKISPVRPDKCPPVIENSDRDLRDMCYKKAISMYGDPLPDIVKKRLDRELNSIISNGYSVMYIIAQKLVKKSNEDGYVVGSRGSVGSSLAATMSGITEVNPLKPHYYCTNCHYSEFDSPDVNPYAGGAGCDMPDKMCPVCGQKLKKDGFDIPFETFLGFKGNKEPDIDLNFSGEYQSHAHDYTEVIFGKGHTFRAGTIAGLADKTAFGYIKNYFEERGESKRNCEINRMVLNLMGVRRSSGQHPGGIIVLPHGEEIYTFTPVQHPANDMTTKTITTHFDYHSIDHNLLKLDILGHDDPTMIRMLSDILPDVDILDIPLDSKEVMSLFQGTEALGITPADIHGTPLGALGIPEFGTDFAMQMVIDAHPTKFSDLVRIAGLAHGTDVWLGNAQTLIAEGKATIATAICTRDDIMLYLISKGLDSEESFKIMEKVRKGVVAKGKCDTWPEWKKDMLDHGVPDWYVWSCEKIKYMFPKAHAAAYVMSAWRIAWCKVFRPLAYYAAFFTIRADAFNYEMMCRGKENVETHYEYFATHKDTLSKKEQDQFRDLRIVQEMYARGFDFWPIDLYRSKATHFQVIDGKLMPPFTSLDGMGEKAAESLEEAARQAPFTSRDDIRNRGKVSKTIVDKMAELGLLKGLPETDQLSLFDVL